MVFKNQMLKILTEEITDKKYNLKEESDCQSTLSVCFRLRQGLHNYIIMPFEEQLQYKTNHFQQAANEDSSNRQRSSSLVRYTF